MKSDESIEAERAALEKLIGPTRAGWYAEACEMEPIDTSSETLRWACRYREMAREAGRVVAAILAGKDDGHVFGSRPCATCKCVSDAILQPYGCDLFREQKAESKRSKG